MQRHRSRGKGPARRALELAVGLLVLLVAGPSAVLAHAELVSSTPADGAVLTEPPTEIVLTYSQGLDEGSSIVLKDADGTEIARAVPAAIGVKEMRATFAPLAPGQYTIESTTFSSEDGEGPERQTVTFTVAEPTPAPPTPEPTAAGSGAPTFEVSEPPTPSPAPSPSPSGAGEPGSDATADYLIPIVIAGLLIGGGLAVLLRRRGAA